MWPVDISRQLMWKTLPDIPTSVSADDITKTLPWVGIPNHQAIPGKPGSRTAKIHQSDL